MHKLAGYIFSPIHYLVFGLFLGIFQPIQWLCLKIGGYKAHKRSVDILNLLLSSTYYLIGCHISFRMRDGIPENRPVIFIANHQSMYDIPPLIWHLRHYHAKFISKIELTKGIPSISFNLKHGGGANIDRKDSKQAIAEILKLARRMSENCWSAVIFPEGTRSNNGDIKPFAVGGIATLLKKVPTALVVPVAIDGSWKLTRFGIFPLSFGEQIRFTVLEPIEPSTLPGPAELVARTEEVIRKALGKELKTEV
ncbi:lysophospholipid acyltransferase family protein [Hufsiella ginkgonis]|uniref:1-acyl-sn-glycerol-3-phosphate acyltransferase n=1 Tax=Hufsiella ginkgonis TaxID=2695274 RepID=A0A7K1Y3C4_9SPHI|nr:lysophospholipid acyltransferase family protein [Hufsiella ginkgonis]MXV17539.1 1-acyl-sn-glycerol-3-phosphate acyltransferase [Hufsiella ginkgonis]